MQRIIKFRAWDRKKRRWMPQPFYMGSDGEKLWEDPENIYLMQFTGLHDKNGKEAYVSDIYRDAVGNIGVIEWDYPLLARLQEIEFEIIGNLYENPGLLEDKPKGEE